MGECRFARDCCPSFLVESSFNELKAGKLKGLNIFSGTFMDALLQRKYSKVHFALPPLHCSPPACLPLFALNNCQVLQEHHSALHRDSVHGEVTSTELGGWWQVILMDHVDWMIDAEGKDTKYAQELASALAQQVRLPTSPILPGPTTPCAPRSALLKSCHIVSLPGFHRDAPSTLTVSYCIVLPPACARGRTDSWVWFQQRIRVGRAGGAGREGHLEVRRHLASLRQDHRRRWLRRAASPPPIFNMPAVLVLVQARPHRIVMSRGSAHQRGPADL